jgi:hypothetical protein
MAAWQERMERLHGKAEVIIGKQRHGPIGTVELSFEGRFTRFGNLVKPWQQGANWRALDALTACETAAVVKADAYGLGLAEVATALAAEGARSFFVAVAEEGAALRKVLGPGPVINVFRGTCRAMRR